MTTLTAPLKPRDVLSLAVLYALAFLLTTLMHEAAHAVVGLLVGRHPVLHATSVTYVPPEATDAQRLASASAGPLFSLAQGLVLLPVVRRARFRSAAATIFTAWMSFHGLTNFSGYLFSTPFAPDADLGTIARLLRLPLPARLVLCGLGFMALRASAQVLVAPLLRRAPAHVRTDDVSERNRYLVRAAVFPWVLGVLFALPSALPLPHWLVGFYTAIAGASSTFVTEFSRQLAAPPERDGAFLEQIPWAAVLALAALTALNLVILARGIALR